MRRRRRMLFLYAPDGAPSRRIVRQQWRFLMPGQRDFPHEPDCAGHAQGRTYAGLLKLEPSDMARIRLPPPTELKCLGAEIVA